MVLALLIAACLLILADAYLTRQSLLASGRELNPIRALLIRLLGVEIGTWGVSAAICAGLVYSHMTTTATQTKLFSYGSLAAIYAVAVAWNLRQLRKR